MKKLIFIGLSILSLAFSQAPASAQFSVDWGYSNDTGNLGYEDLGQWFADNGYASDAASGALFAQTGFIGNNGSDPDAFYWNSGEYQLSLVQQVAGNAPFTSFGVQGGTADLTSSSGPINISEGQDFRLFMNTPTSYNSIHTHNWSTDRSLNASQQTGPTPTNAGGDPQALIYALNSEEWLVAWEDLDYSNQTQGQSDRDYNDAYLKITRSNVTVTPEPVSMALFGLGAGALSLKRLRRKKKTL